MFRFLLCLPLAVAIGCAGETASTGNNAPKGDPVAQSAGLKYVLSTEPTDAKGVKDIRKQGKNGEEVVVVGQVGGDAKPINKDRAFFLIADSSLKPTEGCECPWDFCEYDPDEVKQARLMVKFVDADGKTLQHGAREMFGIKELSTVVVKGKLSRDEHDNVIVLASGIHVRPEKR